MSVNVFPTIHLLTPATTMMELLQKQFQDTSIEAAHSENIWEFAIHVLLACLCAVVVDLLQSLW